MRRQASPERGRDQELSTPTEETLPVWRAPHGLLKRATMLREPSDKVQRSQGASMITVCNIPVSGMERVGQAADGMAAVRHRKRRTQMTTQAVSQRRWTWRQYRVADQSQNAVRIGSGHRRKQQNS